MANYPPLLDDQGKPLRLATTRYLKAAWYVVLGGHVQTTPYPTQAEARKAANATRKKMATWMNAMKVGPP